MKLSTTDPVVAALTLLLTNSNTIVTASNFNAFVLNLSSPPASSFTCSLTHPHTNVKFYTTHSESYLSSAWGLHNIPSQPNITPFALALSTAQVSIESSVSAAQTSAIDSAVRSAASKYHIVATGLAATTLLATSNPAAQVVTPAPVAFVAAAAAVGVGAVAILGEL